MPLSFQKKRNPRRLVVNVGRNLWWLLAAFLKSSCTCLRWSSPSSGPNRSSMLVVVSAGGKEMLKLCCSVITVIEDITCTVWNHHWRFADFLSKVLHFHVPFKGFQLEWNRINLFNMKFEICMRRIEWRLFLGRFYTVNDTWFFYHKNRLSNDFSSPTFSYRINLPATSTFFLQVLLHPTFCLKRNA